MGRAGSGWCGGGRTFWDGGRGGGVLGIGLERRGRHDRRGVVVGGGGGGGFWLEVAVMCDVVGQK